MDKILDEITEMHAAVTAAAKERKVMLDSILTDMKGMNSRLDFILDNLKSKSKQKYKKRSQELPREFTVEF